MASIRCSGGGEVEVLVVARMTERRIEAVRRLVDKLALIVEALSLRLPSSNLSLNFRTITRCRNYVTNNLRKCVKCFCKCEGDWRMYVDYRRS